MHSAPFLAALALLLCTFALLLPAGDAYRFGDPVSMLKRAQYKGVSALATAHPSVSAESAHSSTRLNC